MRVNFNYFISEDVFDYIVQAVALVADHGARLIGDYTFDIATGLWRHRDGVVTPPLRLTDVTFTGDGMVYPRHHHTAPETALAGYLLQATGVLSRYPMPSDDDLVRSEEDVAGLISTPVEHLRWFDVAKNCLVSRSTG